MEKVDNKVYIERAFKNSKKNEIKLLIQNTTSKPAMHEQNDKLTTSLKNVACYTLLLSYKKEFG